MLIYLASPLGFSEAGRSFYYGTLVPAVTAAGHEVIDPWRLTDEAATAAAAAMPEGPARRAAWQVLDHAIAGANRAAIDRCDAVLAVLDGCDVDSGTAAEIGYAFARGKPILGYRGDTRATGDNEGSAINLQVEYFIRESGGDIVAALAAVPSALAALRRS